MITFSVHVESNHVDFRILEKNIVGCEYDIFSAIFNLGRGK